MSTKKGRAGEDRAADYLQRQGYTILARNVRGGRGEIDIVAQRGELLAFVEVKAHQQRDASLQAVTEDKCARLHSAAEAWLSRHPKAALLQCRFDLIIVSPVYGVVSRAGIEHLEDIFR